MSVHARRSTLLVLAMLTACAASPSAFLHTDARTLPPTWQRARVSGTTVALHYGGAGGGAIAASMACDAVDEDAPLDVLLNHLLLRLSPATERGRQSIIVDGRAALRVALGVHLDGVAVDLDLVLFKKDGCVVDIQLVADRAVIEARRADFDRFVAGVSVERFRQ